MTDEDADGAYAEYERFGVGRIRFWLNADMEPTGGVDVYQPGSEGVGFALEMPPEAADVIWAMIARPDKP